MRKFFNDNRDIVISCVIATAIGSSPALGDALPGADMKDAAISTNNLPSSAMESTSAGATARQHVKHLRAHKKVGVDTLSDSNLSSEKLNNSQSAETHAVQANAVKKLSGGNMEAPAVTKVATKRRAMTAKVRKTEATKASTEQQTGPQLSRQRDFFSDIFGGDD